MAEPASASRAREFVCGHLLVHNLRHLQDDLTLVASELVTNAIMHAQTMFTVVLERAGPSVTLTVQDLSPLIPVMATGEARDAGGRGLVIVNLLSREWGVITGADGSKTVWVSFGDEAGAVAAS